MAWHGVSPRVRRVRAKRQNRTEHPPFAWTFTDCSPSIRFRKRMIRAVSQHPVRFCLQPGFPGRKSGLGSIRRPCAVAAATGPFPGSWGQWGAVGSPHNRKRTLLVRETCPNPLRCWAFGVGCSVFSFSHLKILFLESWVPALRVKRHASLSVSRDSWFVCTCWTQQAASRTRPSPFPLPAPRLVAGEPGSGRGWQWQTGDRGCVLSRLGLRRA